jgi:polyisoprenoid-binding protein YceI
MTRILGPVVLLLLTTMADTALAQANSGGTALDVKASGVQTFYADSRVGNNQLTFFSESTLEDFTGVCNQIGGDCQLDPKNLEQFTGRFFVRVEDMKTGIDLRDEHMRGKDWLDAQQFPQIMIDITSVTDVKKQGEDSASMVLVGTCALHGKTDEVRIPCTLKYLVETPRTMRRVKGDLIRLRAKFPVKLSDYDISGPKGADVVGLKVADEIDVKVTVFGSTERPPDALKADESEKSAIKRPPPRRPPDRPDEDE